MGLETRERLQLSSLLELGFNSYTCLLIRYQNMESSQVKIVLSAFVHDYLTEDLSYYIVVSLTKKCVCFHCLLFS